MNCWKCGSELAPGQGFCGNCGAAQSQAPQDQAPPSPPAGQTPPPFQGQTPPPPAGGANNQMILTVFAVVCAAVYGLRSIIGLFGVLGNLIGGQLLDMFRYYGVYTFFSTVFGLLCVLLGIWMCVMLLLMAFKRTPQNTCGLLLCLGGGGAALIVVRLLQCIVSTILFYGNFTASLWTTAGAVVTVGGVYAILHFLLGEEPIIGKDTDELKAELQYTLSTLGQTIGEASSEAAQKAREAKAAQDARSQAQAQAQAAQNAQAAWSGGAPQPGPYGQPGGGYAQPGGYGQTPPPPQGYAPFRLKTDRSLLMYILLNIVTCGIYSYFFFYALARDVNVACEGDGKHTAGLLKFILLSIVTCGIYSWVWYYSLGNRLAFNAPRYGMNFQENGTTILLWMLFGVLLCGIGPFIAWNIIIKNTNMICGAYNHAHNM